MNLRKVTDSIIKRVYAILDARYERKPCRGTTKDKYADGSEVVYDPQDPDTWKEKQQIPTREEAIDYCKDTDIPRYMAYRRGDPKVKTPHYTGVYYCPYCSCWHVTTHNNKTLKANTKERILKAFDEGFYSRNLPDDGKYCVLLDFPNYSKEEIEEYKKAHIKNYDPNYKPKRRV